VRALLTQEQLAERAGLSVRTVRGLESGAARQPRTASVRQLGDALGLTASELQRLADAARNTTASPAPTVSSEPAAPPADVPRQLPADAPGFVGRTSELAALQVGPDAGPDASAVVISAVDGMAGVGKTALAVHAAHRLADQYPDGQLFVDLHGFTRGYAPVEPAEALDRMLRTLGVPGGQIPDHMEERSALYRSKLAGRRVLVLLDNAADEAQVEPLLPGTAGCLVLVTSRRRLTGLDQASAVSVDLLPMAEAVQLFATTAGGHRVAAEPPALLAEVVELCGRLPLAIRIAAARLRSRPTWSVTYLAERLRDHQERLVELDVGEQGIAAALDLSYQQLTPELRRVYRRIGLHPGPDLDIHATAALVGAAVPVVGRLVDELLDNHLLAEPVPERYRFHDLTRSHAADLAAREEPAADRDAALARLFHHYASTAAAAMDVAYPFERERRPRIAAAATPAPALGDAAAATAWLDAELPNLLATARHALVHGGPEHAIHLSATLHRHLGARGRNTDAEALHGVALAAATGAGDHAGEITARIGLGLVHRLVGRHAQALEHNERAVALARKIDHRAGEMEAVLGLAFARRMRGEYGEAAGLFHEARRLAGELRHRPGELDALIGLGSVQQLRGRNGEATTHLELALDRARDLGHRTCEMQALAALGWVMLAEARHEPARDHFARALAIATAEGFRIGELNALLGLGVAAERVRDHRDARARFREVLRIAEESGNRNMQFEALQHLGRINHAAGQPAEALAQHRRALDLATALDQAGDVVRAHDGLAHAHRSLGQHAQARQHWQAALDLLDRLGIDHTEDAEANVPAIRAHLAGLDR
jgi:tetratricopeptide (TPR) repeat protein